MNPPKAAAPELGMQLINPYWEENKLHKNRRITLPQKQCQHLQLDWVMISGPPPLGTKIQVEEKQTTRGYTIERESGRGKQKHSHKHCAIMHMQVHT